jgi:hypothetical protein
VFNTINHPIKHLLSEQATIHLRSVLTTRTENNSDCMLTQKGRSNLEQKQEHIKKKHPGSPALKSSNKCTKASQPPISKTHTMSFQISFSYNLKQQPTNSGADHIRVGKQT